jgi:hypothetical protein
MPGPARAAYSPGVEVPQQAIESSGLELPDPQVARFFGQVG